MGCSFSVLCQMVRADHLVRTQSHQPLLLSSLTLCCSMPRASCMITLMPELQAFLCASAKSQTAFRCSFHVNDMYGQHAKRAIYMEELYSCHALWFRQELLCQMKAKTSLRGWRGVLPRMGACRVAQGHFLPA